MKKKTNFLELFLHLLFCVATVLFFRNYSCLRPGAFCALYKEYITGVIVLFVFYLNYLILYPRFYSVRRLTSYVLAIFACLLSATLAEQMLVHKQIFEIVKDLGINLRLYFTGQAILIFLRDSCFFLFSFMICEISSLNGDKRDLYQYLRGQKHLIVAKEIHNKLTVTLSFEDITYCQQVENYAYIYLLNGKRYYRNCTLSVLADDIGPDFSVRVSRSMIVMYAYVQSFDQNTVYIQTHEGIKGVQISDYYREQALALLIKHCGIVKETNFKPLRILVNGSNQTTKVISKNEIGFPSKNSDQIDDNNLSQQLLSFIKSHPDCKGTDITDHFGVSLSTVNRTIRQLRKEGLIEYSGSKKTGGYHAIEPPTA